MKFAAALLLVLIAAVAFVAAGKSKQSKYPNVAPLDRDECDRFCRSSPRHFQCRTMCYSEIKKPLSDQDPCVAFCRGSSHVSECIRTCHKRGYFDDEY
ncbi:hypothetical protein AKO1_006627 [Acrasis kona]|uniref:Uncharacterized protein n=1 Tax=Acrasis kona TaxID=1008807 RepID=A0AAW2Z4G9_9EUKA